jgi:superfamily II DNA helicase RecQ
VIFSNFNAAWTEEMTRALRRRGFTAEIPHYRGGMSKKKRRDIVDGLNSGKYPLVLANVKALQTGANMQGRANFVGHINTPWEPDNMSQATGRVARRGQKRRVTVLRPIGSPVEEIIDAKVSAKVRQGSQLVGATSVADAQMVRTMRKPGRSAKDAVAEALGIDPSVFGKEQGSGEFEIPELLSDVLDEGEEVEDVSDRS